MSKLLKTPSREPFLALADVADKLADIRSIVWAAEKLWPAELVSGDNEELCNSLGTMLRSVSDMAVRAEAALNELSPYVSKGLNQPKAA